MSAPSISARPARRRRSSRRPPARRSSMSATSRRRRSGEAILVPEDSPIQTVADLKGKNVALNKGSNVHYLLVKALEKAGVSYSDITTSFLPPADARAAFEKGAVDAWVIWDPFLAAAEAATGARQLAERHGLVENHQFYLASRSFVEAHPEVVDVVVRVARRDRRMGRRAIPATVAEEFSPGARHSGADPRSRGRPPDLRHQADRRRGRRAAAEDRRRLLRARPDPERDQDRRRRAEAAVVSAAERPRTSSGSCRPMATAAISARPSAAAPSTSTICGRWRRRPMRSAISACSCRPARAARIPGWSPRRWRRRPSGSASWWRSGRACSRPASPPA